MARNRLTAEEEARLVAEVEASRDDDAAWDFAKPRKIERGARPTAVLSVRIPLQQLQLIRELAERRRVSLSELIQEAVAIASGTGGPRISTGNVSFVKVFAEPESSGSYQPPSNPTWDRPDSRSEVALRRC